MVYLCRRVDKYINVVSWIRASLLFKHSMMPFYTRSVDIPVLAADGRTLAGRVYPDKTNIERPPYNVHYRNERIVIIFYLPSNRIDAERCKYK